MDNKWLDDARVENVIAADLLDIIGDRFVLVRTVAGYTFEVRDGRQYDCQTAIADVTWPADAPPDKSQWDLAERVGYRKMVEVGWVQETGLAV
jgi:hypothetical protein